MIKAVFFDLYNTVARFHPPREDIQVRACAEFGIEVDPQALRRAYPVADDFWSRENGRQPIADRPPTEQQEFFARYEQLLLARAGVQVERETGHRVFQASRSYNQGLALFDDVLPTLKTLRRSRLALGLLSNLNDDLGRIARELGIAPYLGFTITSQEAGATKPNPPIFLAALGRAKARPHEAVHVGDQYSSDVVGAKGVGIHPVLLDRDGFQDDLQVCPILRSLRELPALLEGYSHE
ncbi:MAG: HAD family hydrolase [Chloroflexi bacterium]|nr:HAD family hydrolase [Chloroflexota bacterium]